MPARLQDCVITSYDVIDNEGELVHYAFYADVEHVNAAEALKDLKWVKAMNEEVKSIEDNNCNARNLINYLIKLFLEYWRRCIVINWI